MRARIQSLTTALIYAAVLVRVAAWFEGSPSDAQPAVQAEIYGLLAAYGLLLLSEPALTCRFPRYPFYYLVLQSGLTLVLLFKEPGMDFLPILFFPLSFQAVQFFRLRWGFVWIGAFSVAAAGPLLSGWRWQPEGIASVLVNSGTSFLIGSFAHLIRRADRTRLENQRLLAELQRAGEELKAYAAQAEAYAAVQERSRLARELHDSVTQTLFSMNLTVQGARLLAGKNPQHVAAQLDRLQQLARSAAGEIQLLVSQPGPGASAEEDLGSALMRLAAERQDRDGLRLQMEIRSASHEKELSTPVSKGLYRIAQEALNNVAKHAGVREASACLNLETRPYYLEIVDHGVGFQTDRRGSRPGHLGLPGMADRAREMGWVLKIDSHPGQGTRIRVEEQMEQG
jgi:signal transduction histidine kinase